METSNPAANVPIATVPATGKPSASSRSPFDRVSAKIEVSHEGMLVTSELMMSAVGSKVEYAVEAALEIALTSSVKVAAGSAASVDNADSRSVKLVADEVAGSSAAEKGSVPLIKFWKPCSVSVARVLSTVDRLTSGNSPNGVGTFAGESGVTAKP